MRRHSSIALAMIAAAALLVSCTTADPVITAKIKARMLADGTVRSCPIAVETKSVVVTLTGNIDSLEAKQRALELAKETGGVVEVVDMIEVRTASGRGDAPDPDRSLGEHLDDAAITIRVKTRLLNDPMMSGMKIDVDTREGVVFLTGSVLDENEKEKAVELARTTKGVRDVRANLTFTTS